MCAYVRVSDAHVMCGQFNGDSWMRMISCSSSGWDHEHKVSRSDVGTNYRVRQQHQHRHHRSSTPPERETFSELGPHGNGAQYKQVCPHTEMM